MPRCHGEWGSHKNTSISIAKVFERQREQIIAPVDEDAVPDEAKALAERIGGSAKPLGSGLVDNVFDIPILLGSHLFDFSYGKVPEKGIILRCYEVLGNRPAKRRNCSLWQRFFGR